MSLEQRYPILSDEVAVEQFNFDKCWTVTNKDGTFSDMDIGMALLRAGGNISAAAKMLKMPRRVLDTYILRNPEVREFRDDLWATTLDNIEEKHVRAALAGDTAVQRFFLVTKAKDRGYVTRSETTGKGGEPIEGNFRFNADVSDVVLEALLAVKDAAVSKGAKL